MSVTVRSFTFNPFAENTYLLHDETASCCLVDPGCHTAQEEEVLCDYIEKHALRVRAILNTHCHIDHVLGNAFCQETWSAPLHIPRREKDMLREVAGYATSYGIAHYRPATADKFLEEGQVLSIGNFSLRVLFTPGHSPGHVALL